MYLLWSIFALLLHIVPTCWSQSAHDCSKYCHKSCSDYFPGSEFSPCVTANVKCDCGLEPTVRTVMIMIGIFVFISVCLVCFKGCRKKCDSGSTRQYPAVVPHIGTAQVNPIMSGGYQQGPGIPFQPNQNPYYNNMAPPPSAPHPNIMQTGGFIDAPPSYDRATIVPPETEPPPSYNYTSKYSTYK